VDDEAVLSSDRLPLQSAMPEREPTHGEILFQIGELKGSLNALALLMSQRREEINGLFTRVGVIEQNAARREEVEKAKSTAKADLDAIEKRILAMELTAAKWAGICLAAAFISPFIMPRIERAFHAAEQQLAPPAQVAPRP
jgi:hypothetical protein